MSAPRPQAPVKRSDVVGGERRRLDGSRPSAPACWGRRVAEGREAIEAFEGSLKDAKTLPSQVRELEQRFGLSRVIVVTDRGIGTTENVTLLSETAEFAFITALKAPQVRKLVKEGALQLSVFDELNLAEIACESCIPASGWSSAAARWWPPTAPARAENCLRAPSVTWLRSSAGWRPARCTARPTSALRSARWPAPTLPPRDRHGRVGLARHRPREPHPQHHGHGQRPRSRAAVAR